MGPRGDFGSGTVALLESSRRRGSRADGGGRGRALRARAAIVANIAIVVNADDLGMSHEVNEATFDLLSKGRISSATMMANAPATREAATQVSKFPRCSFGVHLNLTQFEPLTGGAWREAAGRRTGSDVAGERKGPAKLRAAAGRLLGTLRPNRARGVVAA